MISISDSVCIKLAVQVVNLVLDNLGGPTEKFPDLGFKAYIKIFNGYKLETLCFADSGKGKAAFLRFIFPAFFYKTFDTPAIIC